MATQEIDRIQGSDSGAAAKTRWGFATRKRRRRNNAESWWQTITHYTPEPWLIARRAADAKRLRLMMYGAH
jgi:hypothetical protein